MNRYEKIILNKKVKKANQRLRELEKQGYTSISDAYKYAEVKARYMKDATFTTDSGGRFKFRTDIGKMSDDDLASLNFNLDAFLTDTTSTIKGLKGVYIPAYVDVAGEMHPPQRRGGKYSDIINAYNVTDKEFIQSVEHIDIMKAKSNAANIDKLLYVEYDRLKQEIDTITDDKMTMDDIETMLKNLGLEPIGKGEKPTISYGAARARVEMYWRSFIEQQELLGVRDIETEIEEDINAIDWGNLKDDI